jgi:Mor family transcriptional regulator
MRHPSINEIIEVIGIVEAGRLVDQIGGVTYYFPSDGKESPHVSLSPVAWQAMCSHYGDWVYIPKDESGKREVRNAEIRKLRAEGAHIIDLAIKFRLSDRQIKTICSGVMKKRPSLR